MQAGDDTLSDTKIEAMIQARIDARTEKNWGEADRIRDELQAAGIILEDGPQGTTMAQGISLSVHPKGAPYTLARIVGCGLPRRLTMMSLLC